jgi:hypothetical protein
MQVRVAVFLKLQNGDVLDRNIQNQSAAVRQLSSASSRVIARDGARRDRTCYQGRTYTLTLRL